MIRRLSFIAAIALFAAALHAETVSGVTYIKFKSDNTVIGVIDTTVWKTSVPFIRKTTATTKTTAGAVTYTAAEILGGLILRDPNGAARADLFPTAASIITALYTKDTIGGAANAVVGHSFDVAIRNDADAAETITMTTNTGLTLSGVMTIPIGSTGRYTVVVTSATTCTIYGAVGVNGDSTVLKADGSVAGATGAAQDFGTLGIKADAIVGSTTAAVAIAGKVGSSAAGSAISVTGGAGNGAFDGGASSLVGGASGAGATGNGGASRLTGGVSLATNGTGGAATIAGGVGKGTGAGGAASVTGGTGGVGDTGNGGAASLVGGASSTGATGAGGAVAVTGAPATSTNGAGGAVTTTGGAGVGTGAGGANTQVAGAGGATGAGGNFALTSGRGGSTSGAAGTMILTAGAGGASATVDGGASSLVGGASGAGATGSGGAVNVTGGAASSTNGTGGNVNVTGGAGNGNLNGGNVVIAPGAKGGTGVIGFISAAGPLLSPVTAAQAISGNGQTITLPTTGRNKLLSSNASYTGLIISAGRWDGEEVELLHNTATNTLTFAVAATSNVADGASAIIQPFTRMRLVWDATSARWYHGN